MSTYTLTNECGGLEILPATHFKGDLAAYTGKSEHLYGATGYELILLEGHRKGDNVWTYRKPGEAVTA